MFKSCKSSPQTVRQAENYRKFVSPNRAGKLIAKMKSGQVVPEPMGIQRFDEDCYGHLSDSLLLMT